MLVGWTVALEIYQGVGIYVVERRMPDGYRYASTALWFAIGSYAVFAVLAELLALPLSRTCPSAGGVSVSLLRVRGSVDVCDGDVLATAQAHCAGNFDLRRSRLAPPSTRRSP